MANFQVKDAYGSVISIESSVYGSAHRQIISGNLTTTPSGNQSVSGTVGASIIGLTPVNVVGSVYGTVAITGNPSISGTVNIGIIPGSVVAFQGTTPWIIGSIYGNVSGSVVATISNTNVNVSGSVAAFQAGTQAPSMYGMRNDAVASFLGANLTVRPIATDSAGRTVIKPFAPEESRVEGYISLTSTSVTTLVAAAGAGLRNYITDLWFANTGAANTLVTFSSNGGASILGYTIAPTLGGSNLPGLTTPIRTGANETFDVQAGTATSILYATVKGFKAP